jgi:hypothetical protein
MAKARLLPKSFKLVGIGIIILFVLVPLTLGIFQLVPGKGPWLKHLVKSGLLLGLLIFALTNEKSEDEFVTNCRLKEASTAFFFAIFAYMANEILILFKIQQFSYSAFHVFIMELIFYLLSFHLAIRGGIFKNGK